MKKLIMICMVMIVALGGVASADTFLDGGNRLAGLQNNDGAWDWPLDNGNPATGSAANTVGPIAMGLAKAYKQTGDAGQLTALQNAGGFLLNKTNFSTSDGYLAAELDDVFGGSTYGDHVRENFYDKLASGTYDRNGTLYTTASYVDLIRTGRANQGIANLAAWDIGMGLYAANAVGADTSAWIDGTKAEINELDGSAYYDVIGLAGGLMGLASVGEDFDATAGEHAAAGSLGDLASVLEGYQLATGGFTWNSDYVVENDLNEAVQETSYSMLALNEFDSELYQGSIQSGGSYIESIQFATGGWANSIGGLENNEITGEALWAASVVPVPSSLLLGGLGIGIAGWVRKKREAKNS